MINKRALHEDFSQKHTVKASSERSFGFVFAAVFTVVGLVPLWNGGPVRIWAMVLATAILAAALVRPRILAPANRAWFRFGMLLGAIVAPVVMMLVFLVAVTPTALAMRLLGKDSLRLKFDPQAQTYWLRRDPPGPDPTTMSRQF